MRGIMKRGPFLVALRFLLTASVEQKLASLEVALLCCTMKGGLVCLESGILLATTIEQKPAKLDVPFSCGVVKRGKIPGDLGILIKTTVKQKPANLEVAFTGSKVQRDGTSPMYVSIEVQLTDTHIPRPHCLNEPLCADGPPFLAQRVSSARCLRRRKLDNATLMQGEHGFVVQQTPAALQTHLLDIQRRQLGLQGSLDGCQRSALGIQHHDHLRPAERRSDLHCYDGCTLLREEESSQHN